MQSGKFSEHYQIRQEVCCNRHRFKLRGPAICQSLNVLEGILESHNFSSGSFDVVVALHVIEHLHDPIRTLTEINRLLSEGGMLITIVPCVTHIKARLAGIKWKYFGPPSHLWYFSPRTFALLLEKTGFAPVYSSCFYNRAHLKTIARKGQM